MVEAGRLMPGRWTAAAYTCLMVALADAEPAVVSLTVHDHVQLDRVTGTGADTGSPLGSHDRTGMASLRSRAALILASVGVRGGSSRCSGLARWHRWAGR
jgi:hypothetical protein